MIKEKILLIAGCSHAAGSEIDGSEDSVYNREHSFGNLLAKQLGMKPVNIAIVGATNSGIARSVLMWFKNVYDPTTMDVNVLVCWTEPIRLEIPHDHQYDYATANPCVDWFDTSQNKYVKVIIGWNGLSEHEKLIIPQLHKFMANNEDYLQIYCANLVLQLQYFLNSKNVGYIMCNTMQQYNDFNVAIKDFLSLVDPTKYYQMQKPTEGFYPKYKRLGYVNENAKYWHHGAEPHMLYAEELLLFNEENKCLKNY